MGFVPFSLVYAPPADLIMSMPPETRYNKFSPLQWHFWWKQHWADQGAAADCWNWLWLLCHHELYRSGFATLKGENGSTLREGAGLGPSPLGEKAGSGWSSQSSHRVLSVFFLFPSSLGQGVYIRCISARNRIEVPHNTKITVLQGTGYLFTKTSYGPTQMHFVKC